MNEVDNFDEREVITQLTDNSFNRRGEILERLQNYIRMHRALPFNNNIGLYQALNLSLTDSSWDVRLQCIKLISETIPFLRIDVDSCINIVLPQLIANIGDSKVTVRRAVIQTLHSYMKHTNEMPNLMAAYVQHGQENVEPRVRKEAIVSLPLLITRDFAAEDYSSIIVSLCKKLVDNTEDGNIQQCSLNTLKKLQNAMGDLKFRSYLMRLAPELRRYVCERTDFSMDDSDDGGEFYPQPVATELTYGFVPPQVMNQLNDQDNFRSRNEGVEQLKHLLNQLGSVAPLMPHIDGFIRLLNTLLEDNNFKILTVTLEIMGTLVQKVSKDIRPHLKPVIGTLTKRMGDNKNVIRQSIVKVITQLMQILPPKLVLLVLNDNLQHRSPRVRTETINCVIHALLTFPSYEFDLASLCSSMAYCLLDSRRTVRHACLECIAVLAQCLGVGKTQPLMSVIEELDQEQTDGYGVMAAVQARLSRRQLPRSNDYLIGKFKDRLSYTEEVVRIFYVMMKYWLFSQASDL